MHLMATYNVTT